MKRLSLEDLIWTGVIVLLGEQGVDWQSYVSCELYWRIWGLLNRN